VFNVIKSISEEKMIDILHSNDQILVIGEDYHILSMMKKSSTDLKHRALNSY
jgi:hypothetical protein